MLLASPASLLLAIRRHGFRFARWLVGGIRTVPRRSCAALLIICSSAAIRAQSEGVASVPLAPRSGPRGATLFTTLPPEQTGVNAPNPYDDRRMWGERFREFTLGAIGTGIAIGDYDGDGKPDIYVVCKTGKNHLFRNLGNFKFEDVTDKAGVGGPTDTWKQGATWVDVNNDGRLDLYVCRFAAPNLLYINQGDGTFKEEAAARGLAVSDCSGQGYFCDYDRDGFLDVYLQTNLLNGEAHPTGQRDYLFHNNGDGTFSDVTEAAHITGETQGHAATWWDYNEDGWPDLYVDNDFKEPDTLYRNNGDGTFTNVLSWVVPHIPQSAMGADQADVNNDGHIDLLVADMAATSRYKDHRGMAKLREGEPDTDARPLAAPQYMRNVLFLGTGTSHALEAAFLTGLSATDWTWTIRMEDYDNDGWVDVFFTNGMVRELHNADLLSRFPAVERFEDWIRAAKASPPLNERHLAFRNLGDLKFEDVSHAWGLDFTGVSFGGATGDLDGDGDLDIVFCNMDGNVTVCRNDSDTGHRAVFELRGTVSNHFGIGAVVRIQTAAGIQIRPIAPERGYMSCSEPIAHFGLGDIDTIKKVTIQWPSGIVQKLENLPADRRYTITEPKAARPKLRLPDERDPAPAGQFVDVTAAANLAVQAKERTINELAHQPLLTLRLNRGGPSAAAADLDGDGEDELAIGSTMAEPGRFFSNLGGGTYLPYGSGTFSEPKQVADGPLLFLDANGDGIDDLLVTKTGDAKEAGNPAYQPHLFLNDGKGHFVAAPADALPTLPVSVGCAVAADFDRDGKLDVFLGARCTPWQYPTLPASALLHNEGGKFVDVTDTLAPALRKVGMVTSALWSDVDGDGWLDLVLTLDWGTVKYFHNDQGHGFTDRTAAQGLASGGSGWWNSIASADFNGDGRPDFAVGNVGLNTRYHASPEHPALLYWGEFDDTGRKHLIEAQYEGDKLYPLRGLPRMSQVIPSLAKKFPTFESYATATLDHVFPAERIAAAQKFAATNFSSGVFLSQPDGTYRFQAFPRITQTAPVYGIAAGDFDGDGHADVCFVQNSYAPIPEINRFDGGYGWLLRGDGHGNFAPASPAESAFVVTGDAKALVVTDFDDDGWPDFFVTRNNDVTLALRNQGIQGRTTFRVVLNGAPGNPHAVGARVSVTLKNGATQTSEVEAGAGYRSQSTSALFFGFPADNPPQTILVRWPDGRTSTHPWTPAKKIVLSPPAP